MSLFYSVQSLYKLMFMFILIYVITQTYVSVYIQFSHFTNVCLCFIQFCHYTNLCLCLDSVQSSHKLMIMFGFSSVIIQTYVSVQIQFSHYTNVCFCSDSV